MLGVRLDSETEHSLAAIARRTKRSKSEIAREAIVRYVRGHDSALIAEARRQSENAMARGRTDEDAYWESLAASDDFDAAPPDKPE